MNLAYATPDTVQVVLTDLESYAAFLGEMNGSITLAQKVRKTVERIIKADFGRIQRKWQLIELRLLAKSVFPQRFWKAAEQVWHEMDKRSVKGKPMSWSFLNCHYY